MVPDKSNPSENNPVIAAYIGNVCAMLVSVGLLVGTLRFTRRTG